MAQSTKHKFFSKISSDAKYKDVNIKTTDILVNIFFSILFLLKTIYIVVFELDPVNYLNLKKVFNQFIQYN